MKKLFSKITGLICALGLVLGLAPANMFTAYAAEPNYVCVREFTYGKGAVHFYTDTYIIKSSFHNDNRTDGDFIAFSLDAPIQTPYESKAYDFDYRVLIQRTIVYKGHTIYLYGLGANDVCSTTYTSLGEVPRMCIDGSSGGVSFNTANMVKCTGASNSDTTLQNAIDYALANKPDTLGTLGDISIIQASGDSAKITANDTLVYSFPSIGADGNPIKKIRFIAYRDNTIEKITDTTNLSGSYKLGDITNRTSFGSWNFWMEICTVDDNGSTSKPLTLYYSDAKLTNADGSVRELSLRKSTDGSSSTKVTATVSSGYLVSLPIDITLEYDEEQKMYMGTYTLGVRGYIGKNEMVTVVPANVVSTASSGASVSEFTFTCEGKPGLTTTAIAIQPKTKWVEVTKASLGNNEVKIASDHFVEVTGTISVLPTGSGDFSGTLSFTFAKTTY